MFANIDIRRLAEMSAPDRTFLSVYLKNKQSVAKLEKKLREIRKVFKKGTKEEKEEMEHFDENAKTVLKKLEKETPVSGPLCIFSCWLLNYLEFIPLTGPVEDLIQVDSSPYIRPLAELQDEYENVAVVVADNKKARIFMVSSAVKGSEEVIIGNIKNHVKKGGWSQQRYERRRDKQLLLFAKEIVERLIQLEQEEVFRRIILVGGKEILRIALENMGPALKAKVLEKASDLSKGEGSVHKDIIKIFTEQERTSEKDLWEKIRSEFLKSGLGVVGLKNVLKAAKEGRIHTMIVNRTFAPKGTRCRDCEHLEGKVLETCSNCGSDSLFEIEVVNEIVELLKRSGAETDFADPLPTLIQAGEIAALLRY